MAIVGILIALWSASSYVNSFRHASNIIYDIGEGRPIWKTLALRLWVTAVCLIVPVLLVVIVVASGSVADSVGDALGVGHAAVVAWSMAKWPALIFLVSVLLAFLFWSTPMPNRDRSGVLGAFLPRSVGWWSG